MKRSAFTFIVEIIIAPCTMIPTRSFFSFLHKVYGSVYLALCFWSSSCARFFFVCPLHIIIKFKFAQSHAAVCSFSRLLTMAGVTVQRNSICQQALICDSFYCYCAILLEFNIFVSLSPCCFVLHFFLFCFGFNSCAVFMCLNSIQMLLLARDIQINVANFKHIFVYNSVFVVRCLFNAIFFSFIGIKPLANAIWWI